MPKHVKMTYEDFIEKYGEVDGPKRYEATQTTLRKRSEKYAKQPFKRLTKEWYMWRYGDEEGLARYETFASKTAHTLDNFIRLYGEVDGPIKYKTTISKKNTVAIVRETKGDAAVAEMYSKAVATKAYNESLLCPKVLENKRKSAVKKSKRTKIEKYGSLSTIDAMRVNSRTEQEIEAYKKSLFPTVPGKSSKWALKHVEFILSKLPPSAVETCKLYYGAHGRKEYRIFHERSYLYDLTFISPKGKIIVEFDGFMWHASETQAKSDPDGILEQHIQKLTHKQSYEVDLRKQRVAESKGFVVMRLRSDDSNTKETLNQIVERIKEVCL